LLCLYGPWENRALQFDSKVRRRVADAVEVKQPLRPRVVELGKNRKSTLAMIESGDS